MFIITMNKKQLLTVVLLTVMISLAILGGIQKIDALETETALQEEEVFLPILMYHSILKDPARAGKYVVSPDVLEEDMKYLQENGYTTIVMENLIRYVYFGEALPEKPVMLTFDDGYYNNLTYVYPLLQKYNMQAVISVVGTYTESFSKVKDPNPNYGHLSWDEIKELSDSGYVEIQNHSYNLHGQNGRKGAQKNWGENEHEYVSVLTSDLMKLQGCLQEYCGITPTTFTYPYGQISPESIEPVRQMGFLASLSCYEKDNYITRDPECLYCLNRYNRPSGLSTEDYMKKVGIMPEESAETP